MDLSRLKESDFFGRFYLKAPGAERFGNYFRSIDVLRPFLDSEEWKESVTGYYLNVSGDFDSVRLSYFSDRPDRAAEMLRNLRSRRDIIESRAEEAPCRKNISEPYGGEELRFRKFLYLYTLIGLDITKADLLNARCLIATFRWQVMLPRKPLRPHFEKTFESQSPSYNLLSIGQKEQFWSDLSYWPNPPQVDWAHMMVNMILPGDWTKNKKWDYFLAPKPAETIEDINEKLKEFDFRIPADWRA